MSAAVAEVCVKREAVIAALDPARTETKLSLAIDAVQRGKDYAEKSVAAYLDVLLEVLSSFPVVQSREGALDARILVTVDASRHFVDEYRSLVAAIADAESGTTFSTHLTTFLEGVLRLKKTFTSEADSGYLWVDALSFIARELLLSTVAPLLSNSRWSTVQALMDHSYACGPGDARADFTAFDGFQRSLEVFRKRRLKLQRVSVATDLLKDRIDASSVDFEQVMQADFVLHVASLLRNARPGQAWFARTLGHADAQLLTGFDLFVSARAGQETESLERLFGVKTWNQLQAKLVERIGSSVVAVPEVIDYQGFIAANATIFDH